ncbi:hypothetical protein WMY93_017275 [Mugilogobius chulae]|uniref:Ig-like domain-containing protein n=1 Tax=Mugilogobius chulae TaxID=88201 RepID=A0AAW0NQG9_9GOBI
MRPLFEVVFVLSLVLACKDQVNSHETTHFLSVGDDITLNCSYEDKLQLGSNTLYWYKQSFGTKPVVVSSSGQYHQGKTLLGEFTKDRRFTLDSTINSTFAVHQSPNEDTNPGHLRRLQLEFFTVLEETVTSVREKQRTVQQTPASTTSPKQFSSNETGTYYCAVAACGQVLFGKGTRVNIKDGVSASVVYVLSGVSVFSTSLVIGLTIFLCTLNITEFPKLSQYKATEVNKSDPDKTHGVLWFDSGSYTEFQKHRPPGSPTQNCVTTMKTEGCDGPHRVHWFKQSETSAGGVLYSSGGNSDQCESKTKKGPTNSCVYNLNIHNVSSNETGTYYCAVAACGRVLFGNGTRVNIKDGANSYIIYMMAGALAFSLVLVLVLALCICSIKKKNNRLSTELKRQRGRSSMTNAAGQEQEIDSLNYAALKIHPSSKRQRAPAETDCVYSRVQQD